MPTLQDVARLAGVSTATVSKVLSNTPYFSEETRRKVLDAVSELNYRPNVAARALSSGRTRVLAVVFPYVYDAIFTDPHVMAILGGIESIVTAAGYSMLLSTPRLRQDGIDESYINLVTGGFAEGYIAIDNVPLASVAPLPREAGYPVVVIGYHDALYSVRGDDVMGAHALMTEVLRHGHREIGVIAVPPDLNFALDARLEGIRAVCNERAVHADAPHLTLVEGDFSTSSGRRAVDQLLAEAPDITAIVALNDRMAMGAVLRLHELGRRVPEDISVVGYDNIEVTAILSPPLTTVNPDAAALGRHAAEMLMSILIDHEEPSPVVLPPKLVMRSSLRAIR